MPAFDLDRSDRVIVEAEQRMTRHALRIAGMESKGNGMTTTALMLRVYEDTIAELNETRRLVAHVAWAGLGLPLVLAIRRGSYIVPDLK